MVAVGRANLSADGTQGPVAEPAGAQPQPQPSKAARASTGRKTSGGKSAGTGSAVQDSVQEERELVAEANAAVLKEISALTKYNDVMHDVESVFAPFLPAFFRERDMPYPQRCWLGRPDDDVTPGAYARLTAGTQQGGTVPALAHVRRGPRALAAPLNHTLLLDQRYRVTEDGTGALLQLDFRGFFAGQTTVVEMYKFDPASSGLDNLMALKVTMTLDAPLLSPLHQRRYYDLEIMSGPSFGHLFFSRRSAGDTVPLCGKGLHHAAR